MSEKLPIRDEGNHSFLPGFLYSLIVAFPSWAGVLVILYPLFVSGLRPLHFLFRDLNH
ncbi:MAG TPA: hypothetical protein VFA68_20570 [Terriglobales bacterium]|nr:hypothetical protein [Terriglobales bacterium]